MAKQAVCDQCGRVEPLHLGSLTPGGWLEVQEHSTGPNPPAFQVCGFGCLADYSRAEQAKRATVAAAAEAERPRVRRMPGGHVDFGRRELGQVAALAGLGDARWMAIDDEPERTEPEPGRPVAASEAGHVQAAQADSSDQGGGYVGPGE